MAINFIILILGLNSCKSNEIQYQTVVITKTPELYFPKFPNPSPVVLPIDQNGKVVKDDQTEIVNVLMPYWYWNLIIDYKLSVDETEIYYKNYKNNLDK